MHPRIHFINKFVVSLFGVLIKTFLQCTYIWNILVLCYNCVICTYYVIIVLVHMRKSAWPLTTNLYSVYVGAWEVNTGILNIRPLTTNLYSVYVGAWKVNILNIQPLTTNLFIKCIRGCMGSQYRYIEYSASDHKLIQCIRGCMESQYIEYSASDHKLIYKVYTWVHGKSIQVYWIFGLWPQTYTVYTWVHGKSIYWIFSLWPQTYL